MVVEVFRETLADNIRDDIYSTPTEKEQVIDEFKDIEDVLKRLVGP
jgi:hypothetical protein